MSLKQCSAAKGTNAFINTQPVAWGGERKWKRSDEDVKMAGTEQASGYQVMFSSSPLTLLLTVLVQDSTGGITKQDQILSK